MADTAIVGVVTTAWIALQKLSVCIENLCIVVVTVFAIINIIIIIIITIII